jgi:CheY-like chemotaxis protein
VRVVIADDAALIREGVALLLADDGVEVAAQFADGEAHLASVRDHHPDVALVDIRMPPAHTDEGLRAAVRIGAGPYRRGPARRRTHRRRPIPTRACAPPYASAPAHTDEGLRAAVRIGAQLGNNPSEFSGPLIGLSYRRISQKSDL